MGQSVPTVPTSTYSVGVCLPTVGTISQPVESGDRAMDSKGTAAIAGLLP